ncbi:retrovirus-related Pol polyprotein from transposon 17.6 [Clonorchis sinensis]|uniref:Retrovirus-related Pol polyprotein from transposon 17.6 n=1 Tax=Clonorchis sinensis TaxID=79923 RepID=G7YCI5_CLOSI|nr:retrovirus-related Pol polyprotein from transposon 17.6 [Clonorchis sinensis]
MLARPHSQSVRDFVLQLQTQAAKCDYGAQLDDQLRDRLIAGIQLPELQQKLLLCPDQKFQTIVVESIIPQSDLTVFYPSAVIVPTDVNIRGITGHSVPLVGSCTIPVRLPQGTSIDCNFLVSTSGPSIIGLKVLRSLRTSITLLTFVNVNELKQLILKCSKATGGMQIPKVRLEATGDAIFLKRRIIPFGLREPVRQALNSMCAKGILTPVESSNWATPIVTSLKADGITPRICGDYRLTLNTRLLQRTCTTEEPEDVLCRLSGSSVFSKVDLGSCTIPVRLPQGTSIDCNFLVSTSGPSIIGLKVLRSLRTSITLLTFVNVNELKQLILKCSKATGGMQIPKVRLEVTGDPIFLKRRIIPFGLREPVRQALNSMCAKGILTPVESSNWATPIVTSLKADGITPRICGDYRLTLNTRLLQRLGYIVDGSGFKPDKNRLSPLVNAPSPTNLQELRSLLAALQYYSRFIPNFAKHASCLFGVIVANQFSWSSNHEKMLRALLGYLQTSAVLKPFSTKHHSTAITDASSTGIGASFEQCGRPVICISRRLSKAERGYSKIQQGPITVYWAVKRLNKYLFGSNFTIATDHKALKFLYHPTKSLV